MEFLQTVGEIADRIVSIVTLIGLGVAGFLWLRKWTVIKSEDLENLKALKGEHQKCVAEMERLQKTTSPEARAIRAQIEQALKPAEVKPEPRFGDLFRKDEPFKK